MPKPDPGAPNDQENTGIAPVNAASLTTGGETTLDIGGNRAAAAWLEDRKTIGPYVLLRILGQGGMGQVWLAEQTAPVKRHVALKLIKGGLYDDAVIQRFESERQSLAVMNHPAIAKVFDAGATRDGQPYFVMEYVDGPPITWYCDLKKLKIRDRLELFIKVCEGVQHAHQKAVIHRDLKPSNILVTEVDGKPVPRIIDFGIAKAISSQPGAEQTQLTRMGALIGTPGYMSPEQADRNVLDVDTRTDVYSLGVVLYVLLTGMLPFESQEEKTKPLDEVLRQLREDDPPSPSTKIKTEHDTATAAASSRGTETRQLANLLRGDLDWITMKAVEKDRSRRYGTPSDLAADVERYLENRPVLARPASTGYRLKKYVQRHRLGVATASGAFLVLVAFAITVVVQLRHTIRERDRANRITEFMTRMFVVSEPSESRGNSITAREILDKASKDVDSGLTKDPELQAQMMNVMGTVYQSLGLYSKAQPLFERSAELRMSDLGPRNTDTLKSQAALARLLTDQGHLPQAEKLDREVLEMRRHLLGPQDPDTLASMSDLTTTLISGGHFPEAEKLARETLDLRRRVLGPEHPDTLKSMADLSSILWQEDRFAEAEKLDTETLAIRRGVLGPDHPQTVLSMGRVALDLRAARKYPQEEAIERQVLEISRHVSGPEHPQTLAAMFNLGVCLMRQAKYPEAEQLDRDSLEIRRRVYGLEDPNTAISMAELATVLLKEGRFGEAEKLHSEAIAIQEHLLGPEHPETLKTKSNLSVDLYREGKYVEAEKLNREILLIDQHVFGPEHTNTLTTSDNLFNCLVSNNKLPEAEQSARQFLDIKKRVLGFDHPSTSLSRYDLAVVLAMQGHRDEAFSLLREAADHGIQPALLLSIETDDGFNSLHRDPRFAALVAEAKQRVHAAKPN